MIIRWLFAAAHLVALGIGRGAVWARGRALRGELDTAGLRRVFTTDTWWGVAAALWLATGLVRAFGGLEKGATYYLQNHMFWTKMTLFVAIVALEMRPMLTMTRWRRAVARGELPDTGAALGLARISVLQAALVVLMVLAATAMARGFFARVG
ncbi:MAG: DUF2214 family protein [Acidimicrobiales bacterium]